MKRTTERKALSGKKKPHRPRQGLGVCFYCDERASTIDHYIPTGRGGTSYPTNLVPACVDCNSVKGDRLPDEFFWFCREIVEGLHHKLRWFIPKARKVLSSWAPDLLAQLDP